MYDCDDCYDGVKPIRTAEEEKQDDINKMFAELERRIGILENSPVLPAHSHVLPTRFK